ncbi:MAG TPA: ATP-binding protein [Candidatus Deferrimicrobiaceae bacterium]|nr:ATP-binding protein [Candidatus Deferrimicrobiaceae bacterium]
MYVRRLLAGTFREALRRFPAVLLTGPRQTGKTTFLLREFGRRCRYVSFDDPLERGFALEDPGGFLDRFSDRPVILDEIQYAPDLLPHIKMRIDRARELCGRWILTGSQQFQLMSRAGESLAGRVAILEMLPFGLLEGRMGSRNLESAVWNGGYPEPALHPKKRDLWVRSYIGTYVERDVRQLQNVRDLRSFEQFVGLCAARHGQVFNTAEISRECGRTLPTVKAWGGLLAASYVAFLLPPYHRNFGKRLVKTPKMYFLDPALVCEITRQPDGVAALFGGMGGAIFEGFVVSEAVKVFTAVGRKPDLFFWRSHDGLEVDLIVQAGSRLYPVEIKLTATPTLRHLEPLDRFRAIAGNDAAGTGILVCRAREEIPLPHGNLAIPWRSFPSWLMKTLRSA